MINYLLEHAKQDPVSFHMPGHKGADIFRRYGYREFVENFADCDITEIPGADNLFQAEGIIKDVMDRYAGLYGVKKSYLQVNGTSGALIASVLAAVKPGRKLVMARNCHKSVFNALRLGGISPVYAQPEFLEEYGISGAVPVEEIERCLDENPDADAVILPSPNYYGICSDIEGIAEAVHSRGKVLIVDQAHGAHLKFFHRFGYGEGIPASAEDCGADIAAGSIHKTLASLTQSAVLNLNSDRVDSYVLEDKLQMIETTSPSYILMSFLDINADLLEKHGKQAIGEWKDNLDYFYEELGDIPGLKVMRSGNMDPTKVNIDMSAYGIDGMMLEQLLMEYGIFSELHAGNVLMFMTGIGNTRVHYDRALDALRNIAAGHELKEEGLKPENRAPVQGRLLSVPQDKEMIPLTEAAGRISAGLIIPYPPGIPCVCPGEEITEEMIDYIKGLRDKGEKVIGISDKGYISAGK